ncbi:MULTISPECIES: hypothetical protein [Flavobacteriaceae]|uniref:Uncharacterized protein n=2 Tax=Flavobacteriaceae TaxID=49546 RepID=A0A4Y8AW99_9FLAO|nr:MULTISPECIES: hypothetical protein [Flavobacteriaceae]TEW76816.1 hypothetical protein E2488_02925 [Gramella jeungdoensis]GGK49763.1 hypothetical protein GCM10007963_17660 [Lutibacter litoralis]
MTKISAIILSLTILFQSFNFDLEDLNNIPALADHISCHLDSGDSFVDFFEMHYGSESNNHEQEHKEHKELPFKHQHLESHFQMVYILCVQNYPFNFNEVKLETNNFTYKEPTTNLFINNLFQPPQKLHS